MSKKSIRFPETMENYIKENENIPGRNFSEKVKYLVEKGLEKQYQEEKIENQIHKSITKIFLEKEDYLKKEIYKIRVKNRMLQKMILLIIVNNNNDVELVSNIYKSIRDVTFKELKSNNLSLNFLNQYIEKKRKAVSK